MGHNNVILNNTQILNNVHQLLNNPQYFIFSIISMHIKKKNITEINYNKNWLQFILEKRILCQDGSRITVLIKKNKTRITPRSFLTLKQKKSFFLFLGWGNRNLFWYLDFLGWQEGETVSWKMYCISQIMMR